MFKVRFWLAEEGVNNNVQLNMFTAVPWGHTWRPSEIMLRTFSNDELMERMWPLQL